MSFMLPIAVTTTANLSAIGAVVLPCAGATSFSCALSGAAFAIGAATFGASFDGGTTYFTMAFQPHDGGPPARALNAFTQAAIADYPLLVGAIPPGATHIRFNDTTHTSGTVTVRLSAGMGSGLAPLHPPATRAAQGSTTASNTPLTGAVAAYERAYVTEFSQGWNSGAGSSYYTSTVAGASMQIISHGTESGQTAGTTSRNFFWQFPSPRVTGYGAVLATTGAPPNSGWANVSGFRSL